ncbi:MAG: hydrogenase accessory protein HypB [Desulfobacteraceae bacterium]|nr:MAG: hydrogenase accessory protein HypB [Desulfobacteraceae bacterium]
MEEIRLIEIKEEIHADNTEKANLLRTQLSKSKTFLLNLMSSPGAGKTTTILKTIETMQGKIRTGVIEADIDSMVDAEKIAAIGIEAVQLRTGGFCHLDAFMVEKGLEGLNLDNLDLVIIENVGNLVCPAEFDTGAIKNVMILSVPEGDDKPLKYPLMFTVCDVLLINKIDYLSLSDFNVDAAIARAKNLNPDIEIFTISSRTGEGIEKWTEWLVKEVNYFIHQQ